MCSRRLFTDNCHNSAFKRLKLFTGSPEQKRRERSLVVSSKLSEQKLENFAFCILLSWITAPQDPRERRPSEDGVAWNSLTRVGTCRQGYGVAV